MWTTDEGLPQATIASLLQTRDGYLWIGTEEGLARFDGVRFLVFNSRTVPAFRDSHILALLEDRAGNLWIGTNGGGLLRHRNGSFAPVDTADASTDFVYSLHEDRAGKVWVGARGGMAQVSGAQLTRNTNPAVEGRTIWSIHEDRDGVLWLGTDTHGLIRIDAARAMTYRKATGLPHDAIPIILRLRDGRLVIGTNGAGLYELDGARFVPFQATGTLPSGAITALLEDSSQNLWVGTGAGLARITGGVISAGAPGQLGNSQINTLAEDAEGSIWVGTTSAGLHRLRDGKAYTLTSADGLPSDRAQVVLHDRSGGTWVGTRNGAAHLANGKVTVYSTANGLPNASVRSLFQSSDGAIWLGTDLGGVAHIKDGRLETTVLDPDVPDNTIRAFAEEPGRGVWVGSNGGRLTLFADGKPVRRSEYYSAGRRLFVRAMAVANDGSLWIATDGNGLVHFVDDKPRRVYRRADGLSRDNLRSLYIDAEGTVWIGTDGAGLNRLKKDKITVYRTNNGLFDDRILQILEGDDGRLWMSSNKGIFAIEKRALDAFADGRIERVDSIFIDDRDGMVTRDCSGGSQPAGSKKRDGTLWFPTDGGVVVVDPRHQQKNTHPPPVQIEQVVAERTPLTGGGSFELPRGTKNLEISYTALSLVLPERVRFRYKLEGYDENWIDAGARRTAYYTALRPGQYRFRVIAANNDGVWNSRGAAVTISLAPYLYQRRSFALLVLALIAAAIWGAVTWRIRQIQREAARTTETERRLVVAQRMDALGQLASGIAHDFNNTLMAAYPWAELIRRTYPTDDVIQQASTRIVEAVERAKKVTSQLLDFAQPKEAEATPFDLAELAHDQTSMARAVMPPEIHINLSVEGPAGTTGDKAKIGQVLLNLLLNAADAMPNGGRVTVEVREPSASEAAAWNVQPEKFVLLSVRDTGTGISEDVLPRIFDPFYTTKGVGKGTGLGLAVVHRIVQDHHGSVHVQSAPGKGSTFSVLLPRSEISVQKVQPVVTPAKKGALRGLTVLLVDDESVTIYVVSSILEMEGARVHVATAGYEALQVYDSGLRPDLVVLDLGLPDIPGGQVHAQLRQRSATLPIIIASGYGDRELLDPLLSDPHTSYLQKPYPTEVLIQRVAQMTSPPSPAMALAGPRSD